MEQTKSEECKELRTLLAMLIAQKLGMMCAQTTYFSDNPEIGTALRVRIENLEARLLEISEDREADVAFINSLWNMWRPKT